MLDKDTYKRELVRMWDSVREGHKGEPTCGGVVCDNRCPLYVKNELGNRICWSSADCFEVIKAVEKWSKEHPQKKYKVSKLEYSILEAYMDLSNCGSVKMLDFPVFNRLHELGYFKEATTDTYTRDYFENCEVEKE